MKIRDSLTLTALMSITLLLVLATSTACRTPAGRTGGQVVDDAAIATQVKTRLLNESVLRGLAIDVDSFGGEVTLTGAVSTEKQREHAGNTAKSVYGVKKVSNLLKLKQ